MDAEIFDEHSLRSVCFFCLCSQPSTKYSNIVVRSFNFKRKISNNKSKKLSTSEFLKMEKVTKLFRKSVRFFYLRYQIFNHIFYFRLICQITFSCIMLLYCQTYFKNLAVFTLQDFKSMFCHFTTLCIEGLRKDIRKHILKCLSWGLQ